MILVSTTSNLELQTSNYCLKPIFFAKQSDFRKWLEKNHKKETELLVGFTRLTAETQYDLVTIS